MSEQPAAIHERRILGTEMLWAFGVGVLVAAVVTGVETNTGQIHSLLARRMISALISIPIWLIIILLSPLEAYTSARSVAR